MKQNYYSDLFNECKFNFNKTWSIINSFTGRNKDRSSFITNHLKVNNMEIPGVQNITNAFCNHFANVGYKQASSIPASTKTIPHCMHDTQVQESVILAHTLITSLKDKNSSRYNKLNSIYIKKIQIGLMSPLTILINRCIPNKFKIS